MLSKIWKRPALGPPVLCLPPAGVLDAGPLGPTWDPAWDLSPRTSAAATSGLTGLVRSLLWELHSPSYLPVFY